MGKRLTKLRSKYQINLAQMQHKHATQACHSSQPCGVSLGSAIEKVAINCMNFSTLHFNQKRGTSTIALIGSPMSVCL